MVSLLRKVLYCCSRSTEIGESKHKHSILVPGIFNSGLSICKLSRLPFVGDGLQLRRDYYRRSSYVCRYRANPRSTQDRTISLFPAQPSQTLSTLRRDLFQLQRVSNTLLSVNRIKSTQNAGSRAGHIFIHLGLESVPRPGGNLQPRNMSHLSDYRLLCFDVYGTLIDWESGVLEALQPLLETNDATFSRQSLLELYHELEAAQQVKTPSMRYSQVLATIHPQIAARLSLKEPLSAQSEAFGQSIGNWPAFPDTVDALRRLQKQYKLVVLSNVDRESFAGTNSGPLQGVPFDLIVTAQDVGSYKPDLKNFEHMLREVDSTFGIKKEQVIQTAQSQFHDHQPAKSLGLKSSWIVRPGAVMGNREDEVYDWKFDTLGQMAAALEEELKV